MCTRGVRARRSGITLAEGRGQLRRGGAGSQQGATGRAARRAAARDPDDTLRALQTACAAHQAVGRMALGAPAVVRDADRVVAALAGDRVRRLLHAAGVHAVLDCDRSSQRAFAQAPGLCALWARCRRWAAGRRCACALASAPAKQRPAVVLPWPPTPNRPASSPTAEELTRSHMIGRDSFRESWCSRSAESTLGRGAETVAFAGCSSFLVANRCSRANVRRLRNRERCIP
jgi:hypothetical protein